VSVVVGLIVGGGTFKISVISTYWYLLITYFGGIAVLLSSIFCGLMAYKERKFSIAPKINVLLDKYTNTKYSETLRKNGGAMGDAIKSMEETNQRKANYITVSWILLIIGFVIVFVFLLEFALGGAAVRNDTTK
jgi:Flp pilus assembly protein TadB